MRQLIIGRLAWIIRLSQIHRVLVWFHDRLSFFIFDWTKRARIEFEVEKKAENIAIFAVFQPRGLSDFVKREIEFIRSLGYDVALSVPHGLSDSDRAFVHEYCRFHIERPNLARDFGSYRDAVLMVGFDRIAAYRRVLLVNDSIFFPLGPTERFVREFREATSAYDFVGLCENTESIRHVASFFVDCSSRLFCSEPVREYWRKYRLYNSRFHAIRVGECGLSRVLYKNALNIGIIYSKERIISDMYALLDGEVDLEAFFRSLPDGFFRDLKSNVLTSVKSESGGSTTAAQKARIIDALRKVLEASSVPHSFGLNLIELYQLPLLKRDVYYHDVFDLAQVYITLKKVVDVDILDRVMYELRKKGSTRSETAWGELMIRIGLR